MKKAPGLSTLVGCLVVAAVLLLAPGTHAAAQDSAATWFRYGQAIDKSWHVTTPANRPMERLIRRRNSDLQVFSQRVLVLYPRPSSAYDIAITKILDVFDVKDLAPEFTVVNFQMDDRRATEALQFAEKNNFDLIFAMGSESTAWLWSNYRGGAIPVVSVCSKDPVQLGQMQGYYNGSKTNFAFTSLNVPVDVQMTYVRELRPELKNITVLVDSKNSSAVQTQAEPIAEYGRKNNVQVIWGSVKDPKNAKDELVGIVRSAVKAMRKNDPDLSKSLFWVTGSTSVFNEIQTINENADNVPVISVVPEIVRAGEATAVLSVGISFESNAHLAAIYGADILSGKSQAGDLKVGVVSPPDIAISFLKARAIGMRVPFSFFEVASFVYDYQGKPVRTVESKMNQD
jgi:putative ABC transport system substrate-binding protein